MTTLSPHPFEAVSDHHEATCRVAGCDKGASSPIHDWLAPINAPVHHVFCTCPLCVEWVAKQRTRIGNTPDVGVDEDVLSAITPEEMVQLENLPNGEPFDLDGYIRRPHVEFDYTNQAWMVDGVYQNCGHLPLSDFSCGCYGREHQGETTEQVCNPIVGKPEFSRYDGGR